MDRVKFLGHVFKFMTWLSGLCQLTGSCTDIEPSAELQWHGAEGQRGRAQPLHYTHPPQRSRETCMLLSKMNESHEF